MPEMIEVKSSNLKGIASHLGDLIVWFKNGKAYRYTGAAEHCEPMQAAPSPGSYFAKMVKPQYAAAPYRDEEQA